MSDSDKYKKLIPLLKELLQIDPNEGAVVWLKLQFILKELGEL